MEEIKLILECSQIGGCLVYLWITRDKETHLTQGMMFAALCALIVNLVMYRMPGIQKPLWIWIVFNIPLGVLIYEKLLRKMVIVIYQKCTIMLLLFADRL